MNEQQLELPFESYDDFVDRLWMGAPELGERESYLNFIGLALCEEVGEVAGKLKKLSRGDGNITDQMILDECGDVLYYLTVLTHHLGTDLETIQRMNVIKLTQRLKKGTLKGSGDTR